MGMSMDYTRPTETEAPFAAIYVRVSTSAQEDGVSMDVQEEQCRVLLESEGYQIREEFIYREVRDGVCRWITPVLQRLRRLLRLST